MPSSLGVGLGSVSVGLIMRSTGKYYILNIFVEGVLVLSLALVSTFTLTTPAWRPFVYLFLTGVGYSGMLTIMLLAMIAAVDHKEQALVTSASYTFRSTGSTIGITVASAVFQNVLNTQLWTRLGKRDGADVIIPKVRKNLDGVKDMEGGRRADLYGRPDGDFSDDTADGVSDGVCSEFGFERTSVVHYAHEEVNDDIFIDQLQYRRLA